jgi:hypothetical protein
LEVAPVVVKIEAVVEAAVAVLLLLLLFSQEHLTIHVLLAPAVMDQQITQFRVATAMPAVLMAHLLRVEAVAVVLEQMELEQVALVLAAEVEAVVTHLVEPPAPAVQVVLAVLAVPVVVLVYLYWVTAAVAVVWALLALTPRTPMLAMVAPAEEILLQMLLYFVAVVAVVVHLMRAILEDLAVLVVAVTEV